LFCNLETKWPTARLHRYHRTLASQSGFRDST